jgi:hypothetical protein
MPPRNIHVHTMRGGKVIDRATAIGVPEKAVEKITAGVVAIHKFMGLDVQVLNSSSTCKVGFSDISPERWAEIMRRKEDNKSSKKK